ncbi:cellulose synthase subunit BcsC-related outer membrane protein [uncultured Xylophilus sp.]|uniref:cellulose synthase subunit BcsC-related outer membrane protein n=1 Tax=uncultured Xylophilus sp. TaxID=296832 RepID=UPI0025F66046|nr:cellulose synthase subunit BcsC-related outer membrane protein [uncultured Xylophilus sp.]
MPSAKVTAGSGRTVPLVLLTATLLGAPNTGASQGQRAAPKRGETPTQATALPDTVPAAWEETRRYLEQRVLEAPDDVQARLALAQQQITRASTLRSGIVQLSQLAAHREVGAAALESWRDALFWTTGQPSDLPLFRAYLRLRPKDAAVQARLQEIQRRGGVQVAAAPAAAPVPAAPAAFATASPMIAPAPLPAATAIATGPAVRPQDLPPAWTVPAATESRGWGVAVPMSTSRGAVLPPASAPAPTPALASMADAVVPAGAGATSTLSLPPVAGSSPLPAPRPVPSSAYPAYTVVAAAPDPATLDKVQNLQREIAELEQDRITFLSAGPLVRTRQGERGLSKFTDTEIPLQLRFDLGAGKATIFVTPVSLVTGSPGTDLPTINRFGGGPPLATALPGVSAGSQDTAGVGFGIGYEQGNFAADIGTTPVGFRYTDVNGGVRYRLPVGEDFSFNLNLSRRAVNDSVLSFAGLRDARTGVTWGGVSATGGRLDANYDNGRFGIYGYGALHRLTGHQVQSNTRAELGAGMYWRLFRTPDANLTVGLAASGLAFDKNLSYFTYGHGGYFSPQQYVTLALPLEWQQRSGRLSYQIKGSIGAQNVRTDGAPLFPLDGNLQAAAGNPYYTGSSRTGPGYNLGAALEYQLDPQWFLGGRVALDNARDYRQFIGGMYLRHAFGPYRGPQALPVTSLRSPYGY